MIKPLALIIEDDDDLSIIFAGALEAAGYETEIIISGDVGVQRLTMVSPAVVVLDLHLPKVNGLEILRQIRSDPRMVGVRVVIVTADARMADVARTQADLVLIKPISFSLLRDLTTRFLAAIPKEKGGAQA